MNTDDLIGAMAADARSVSTPIDRILWIAALVGAIAAAFLFFGGIGPRGDLVAAMESPRFLFKFVVTLSLLVAAMGLVLHLARPQSVPAGWVIGLAAAPLLLGIGALVELLVLPSGAWTQKLVGTNAMYCLVLIPTLSLAPLAAIIIALRQGATTHPRLAGIAAGLAASGIGATLYASHCTDDSPLFLAVWYVLAVVIVATIGEFLGDRLLRW